MREEIKQLSNMLKKSDNIVFFGGAGISTESGIPDFRSVDGLYNQKYDEPPETILSHSFYLRNTEKFFEFYRDKMLYLEAKPNKGHIALAKLEQIGKLKAVITQNIDGLHQKAGSQTVYELHGAVLRNYCQRCKKFYSAEFIRESTGIPTCECRGRIKPDVVLYEESLNQEVMEQAIQAIREADMLIIGGTSLAVYPAAGLIQYYRGNNLVLINKTATPMDHKAHLCIQDSFGQVMSEAVNLL